MNEVTGSAASHNRVEGSCKTALLATHHRQCSSVTTDAARTLAAAVRSRLRPEAASVSVII